MRVANDLVNVGDQITFQFEDEDASDLLTLDIFGPMGNAVAIIQAINDPEAISSGAPATVLLTAYDYLAGTAYTSLGAGGAPAGIYYLFPHPYMKVQVILTTAAGTGGAMLVTLTQGAASGSPQLVAGMMSGDAALRWMAAEAWGVDLQTPKTVQGMT